MGRYIQKSGGKRVRPAVLLMAARLSGYKGDRAVLYASVVEFIHTATLVHDDIIDGADLRRGRLAVHSRWGNDITVLLGDYLYIKSMAMALTQDSLEIIRLLCDVTLRMIEGELYQLTKTGDVDITEDEHFEIIRRKTAFLFGGCAQIGGMLGDVSAGAGERAARVRLQPRRRVPAGRRSARLHRRRRSRSASRSAATCAKARSRCRSSSCCGAAARKRIALIRTVVSDRAVTPEQWREILAAAARAPRHRSRLRAGGRVRRARQGLPRRRSRRAASAMRCWRCRTTCSPAIASAQLRVSPANRTASFASRVRWIPSAHQQLRDEIRHHEERYYIHNAARDLRRGVRSRCCTSSSALEARASRSRHARFADAARRRPADRRVSDRRAPRADAQPRQRLQRGRPARVRRAGPRRARASATRRSPTSPS